ncbi:MAG: hypothetical protein ACT4P2_14590 [Pseudomonadota bacterium]
MPLKKRFSMSEGKDRTDLAELAAQPDSAIDYSDAPRTEPRDWAAAETVSLVPSHAAGKIKITVL